MVWMTCFFFVLVVNSMAGSLYYLYWTMRKQKLGQEGGFYQIYLLLKAFIWFFILPGPVLLLARPVFSPLFYRMTWIGAWKDAIPPEAVYMLATVWAAGACISLVRFLKNLLYVKKVMTFNSELVRTEQIDCFQEICRRLHFYRAVHVYENSFVQTPMIIGCIQNNILFPKGRYRDREFAIILEHEVIHARHHDLLVQNLLSWLSILYWFVPVVRRARVDMEDWCETACDITMCSSDTSVWSKKEYFRPMVKHMPVTQEPFSLSLAFHTDELELMVRMRRLKAYDKSGHRELAARKRNSLRQTILAVVLIFGALGLAQFIKNEVYVNLTQYGGILRSQYHTGTVQGNEYVEAGKGCRTRWFYCKEGSQLVITTDLTVDGDPEQRTMARVVKSGGEYVEGYYLSETVQKNTCTVAQDGFYRIEFLQESDLPYHLVYQIN